MPPTAISPVPPSCLPCNDGVEKVVWGLVRAFSAGVAMMHGYERNGGSWAWAVVWFLFGAWVPVLTVSVVCVQRYRGGQWPFPPSALGGA